MTEPTALTNGVHHVGLTVRDLDEVRDFFTGALGFRVVGENPDYPAVFVSDGVVMLTLWRAQEPQTAAAFDRRGNLGLHHLALAVADLGRAFAAVRDWPGVQVEFAPEPPRPGSAARHAMIRIPGGLRLELFAAAPS